MNRLNSAHTPGPWRVDGNDIKCEPSEWDAGTTVATMESSRSPGETKINAHLIAAAPEMKQALETVMQAFETVMRAFAPNGTEGLSDKQSMAIGRTMNAVAKLQRMGDV